MKYFLLLMLFIYFLPAQATTTQVYSFNDDTLEKRFELLLQEIRCPSCSNQSIADSNAATSKSLRYRVYLDLKNGYSDQEIISRLIQRYGYSIHYAPALGHPLGYLLWLGPMIVFIFLMMIIFYQQRKGQK